jgi:hypothetical protein
MKRLIALAMGALLSLLLVAPAAAQTPGVSIVIPGGPTSTVQATVAGQVCGTATTSPGNLTVLQLSTTNPVCLVPGALISFTSNGVALATTLNVPVGGVGSLALEDLSPAVPVTVTVPAVPNASGSITALLNGEVCATIPVSSTVGTVISLPAACSVPNSVITFQGAGGAALTGTVTVPAVGGGVLALPSLTAANPVTVTLPAGTGTLSILVNGDACGSAVLALAATTPVTLPVTCASAGGTVSFLTAAGVQLAALPTVPTAGGALTVASLAPAVVRVTMPAGPEGVITARVNGAVCGVSSTSPLGARTLTLLGDCSIPGAVISFTAGDGIVLDSEVAIPSIISGAVTLPSLDAELPLNVRLPAGTGEVDIIVGDNICATVILSGSSTTTVELPATCIAAGATVSFEVDGVLVDETGTIPDSGFGTLIIVDLGSPVAPAPADTGNYGVSSESSGSAVFPLALASLLGVLALGAVVRRRI